MNSQLFREKVPEHILYDLLEKICHETSSYYYVDLTAYKKMLFHGFHTEFLTALKPYYHLSKTYYLDRTLTYISFTNMIRQICKSGNIVIESEIKYNHSKHYINYIIKKQEEKENEEEEKKAEKEEI